MLFHWSAARAPIVLYSHLPKTWFVAFSFVWSVSHRRLGPFLLPMHLKTTNRLKIRGDFVLSWKITQVCLSRFRRSSLASWRFEGTSCWVRSWRSSWRTTPSCERLSQPIRWLQEPTQPTSSAPLSTFLVIVYWFMCVYWHALPLKEYKKINNNTQ